MLLVRFKLTLAELYILQNLPNKGLNVLNKLKKFNVINWGTERYRARRERRISDPIDKSPSALERDLRPDPSASERFRALPSSSFNEKSSLKFENFFNF